MKTKELIRRLQEADPTGGEHCCIDNADIGEISIEPAYYDGGLHIIERDEDGLPVRGRRTRRGKKIVLTPLTIGDCLEYPGFTVEYANEEDRRRYEKQDLEAHRLDKEIDFSVERDTFASWVFLKIQSQKPIPLGWVARIRQAAEKFYNENRGPDKDGNAIKDRAWGWEKGSWVDRLSESWEEIIRVEWDEYARIIIEFKEQNSTAIYPGVDDPRAHLVATNYLVVGLAGEAGELLNKWKKVLRGDPGASASFPIEAVQELGGCLWYHAELAMLLGAEFETVAKANLDKLADRAARGVLKGNGDNR